MAGVPFVFGNATTSIPLSNLDANFNTGVTIGNTTVGLGNTVTTLGNVTLNNVTIASGTTNVSANSIVNGTSNVVIASSGGAVNIATNGTQAITVDTSQNVGIGTASPNAVFTNYKSLYLNGSSGSAIQMQYGGSLASNIVADNNALYLQNITAISFGTGGTGTGTERMRIDSSGNLLVGTTAPTSGVTTSQVYVKRIGTQSTITADQTGGTGGYNYTSNATNVAGTYYHFNFLEATTQRGSITSNGTITIYATTSDYRLKENVKPMIGALATVAQLKPVTYDWTENKASGQGFIAHELQAVVPDCVTGEKDAVDAEGKPVYQGIDTSFLVATLTAAIQDLKVIVDTQATQIAALQTKVGA